MVIDETKKREITKILQSDARFNDPSKRAEAFQQAYKFATEKDISLENAQAIVASPRFQGDVLGSVTQGVPAWVEPASTALRYGPPTLAAMGVAASQGTPAGPVAGLSAPAIIGGAQFLGSGAANTLEQAALRWNKPIGTAKEEIIRGAKNIGNAAWEAGVATLGQKYLSPFMDAVLSKTVVPGYAGLSRVKNIINKWLTAGREAIPAETKAVQDYLATRGSGLTPLQIATATKTTNRPFPLLEGLVRSSLTGAGKFEQLDKQNMRIIKGEFNATLDDLVNKVSPQEFGELLVNSNEVEKELARRVQDAAWRPVDEAAATLKTGRINIEPFLSFLKENSHEPRIQKLATQIRNFLSPRLGAATELTENLSDEALSTLVMEGLQKGIAPEETLAAQQAGTIPARYGIGLIKRLNEIYGTQKTEAAERTVAHAIKLAHADIDKGMEQFGLREAYKTANETSKRLLSRLNEDITTKMLERTVKEPEAALLPLASPRGYDKYLLLKQRWLGGRAGETSLGAEAFERDIQRPLRWQVLRRAVDEQGDLIPEKLVKIIGAYQKTGERTGYGEELFGREGFKTLKELADVYQASHTAASGNKIYIKMLEASAIGTMLSYVAYNKITTGETDVPWKTAALFLTPRAMAKAFSNPAMGQAIINGVRAGEGTKAFSRMVALVASWNERSIREAAREGAAGLSKYALTPAQPSNEITLPIPARH